MGPFLLDMCLYSFNTYVIYIFTSTDKLLPGVPVPIARGVSPFLLGLDAFPQKRDQVLHKNSTRSRFVANFWEVKTVKPKKIRWSFYQGPMDIRSSKYMELQ